MFRHWERISPCEHTGEALHDHPHNPTPRPCADLALVTSVTTTAIQRYLSQAVRAEPRTAALNRCFGAVLLGVTDLPEKMNTYIYASTYVFYWVMFHPILRSRGYTYLLQMELDVVPVRQRWLERIAEGLVLERSRPFWMLGAHTLAAHCVPKMSLNINGNALYNYSSNDFLDFLLRMKTAFRFGKSNQKQAYYDVAMERYVRWNRLKEARYFVDTPLIRNCPFDKLQLDEMPTTVAIAHNKVEAARLYAGASITPFVNNNVTTVGGHRRG